MNRLTKCLKFELKKSTMGMLYYGAIFIGISALITLFIGTGVSSDSGDHYASSMSFFMPFSIFLFISVMLTYSYHYNYLLMLGNSRKNIMLSQIMSYTIISIGTAIVVRLLEFGMELLYTNLHYQYTNILNFVYKTNLSLFSTILWYFALFSFICFFSLFLGTLRYKFGRMFSRIFWVAFALSWIVVPFIISKLNSHINFDLLLKHLFGIGYKNGIYLATGNFLIIAALFGIIAYFIGIKQEQIVPEKQQ